MAAVEQPSPPPLSPATPMSPITRKGRTIIRRCERCCWTTIIYFPLVVIYCLTTWAICVQISIGFTSPAEVWTGPWIAFLSFALYILLNWSYTTAVFVSPGSPLEQHDGYSSLPTEEARISSHSLTVKSSGDIRFCKKCNTLKPDRAHHCSSCRRCVLKMDHHCPWLATCVGFRNYKSFLLFLIYTCLFCYICFAATASWVWREIADPTIAPEELMPVNYILLAVISGIIGLVLSAFTGFHIYLASKGKTTIESLERVRYLTPIKHSIQQQLAAQHPSGTGTSDHPAPSPSLTDKLQLIHANALPGVTRPEEGEERISPKQSPTSPSVVSPASASDSLRRSYADMERSREHARYNAYQDEQDIKKLPNAFDLGWRRNLRHVFGPSLALAWLPICNSTGDGWHWETSEKFALASEQLARDRERRLRDQRHYGLHYSGSGRLGPPPPPPKSSASLEQQQQVQQQQQQAQRGYPNLPKAKRPKNWKRLSTIMSAQNSSDEDDEDDDPPSRAASASPAPGRFVRHALRKQAERDRRGQVDTGRREQHFGQVQTQNETQSWNDIPEEFLQSRQQGMGRAGGSNAHDDTGPDGHIKNG